MTDADRLDALEMRIAHQDEVIADLNRIVTEQWAQIDRLARELTVMRESVRNSDQFGGKPADEPPPPHY
jgi:SlyX protein